MPLAGVRVLIAEDEGLTIRYLSHVLRHARAEIVGEAANAETAVALALEHRPDLLLLDQNLAGQKTGLDAAEAIRKTYYPCVVMLSANDAMDGAKDGVVDLFLRKPLAGDALIASLAEALADHRPPPSAQ